VIKHYNTDLLYCDTINNRGWGTYLPFLVFEHIITTHQFNPTNYFRTYQDRKPIRDKVWELHKLGWGYTKIHHYLVDNGYDAILVAKSERPDLIILDPASITKEQLGKMIPILKNHQEQKVFLSGQVYGKP